MDKNTLKRLAGMEVITEKAQHRTEAKKIAPMGLFAEGTKAEISKWLHENHTNFAGAVAALNSFVTESGRTLQVSRRATLEACKDELRVAYGVKETLEPFNMALLRKMAGLSAQVVEKEEPAEEPAEEDDSSVSDEAAEAEMPAIIAKIAAKAEGKTGEELVGLIQNVYDAGFKDGEEAHEKEEKEEKEDKEDKEEVKESAVTEAARKPKPPVDPNASLTASVGIDKEDDAGWFAVELAKSGMTVDMEEAMGAFFFNFKTKADEAKAKKLAAKLEIALV